MSLILFFGLAIVIFIVGVTYSALVIRHHWNLHSKSENKSKNPIAAPHEREV